MDLNDDANVQGGDISHAASYSVEQVNVQIYAAVVVDNSSFLSTTEGENTKSESMLPH